MSSGSFESRNSKIGIQNVIGHNLFKDLDVQNEIKCSILFIGFWNLDIGDLQRRTQEVHCKTR